MKFQGIIFFSFLLIYVSSCGEYDTLESNKQTMKRVDSVYYTSKDSLQRLSDSLCEKNFYLYKQQAVDSIRPLRLADIESLIEGK
jgi:hypothetical protein